MWLWMYESWCKDQIEEHEKLKNYAILQGSFHNPEMAKKMVKRDNPDFESTDEEFEKASQEILKNHQEEIPKRRRRIKQIKT